MTTLWLSLLLLDLGMVQRAEDQAWRLANLVEASYRNRDYPSAWKRLREASEAASHLPSDSDVRARLRSHAGALHLVEGNLTRAEAELEAALRQSKNHMDRAAVLQNLASVEMQTGRLTEAESHLREALRLGSPDEVRAWISLSTLEGLRGDWRAAETHIVRALGLNRTPEALWNYAVILDKLGRRAEARTVRKQLQDGSVATEPNPTVDVRSLGATSLRLKAQ